MRVQVTQGGETYLGTIENPPEVATHPTAGQSTRLIVTRDDNGTKVYAWPNVDAEVVELAEAPVQPVVATQPHGTPVTGGADLSHLAPPPGGAVAALPAPEGVQIVGSAPSAPAIERVGSAPPVGSTFGGAPMPAVPAAVAAAQAPIAAPVEPAPPTRFMVKLRKGSPRVFHTRPECPRVSGAEETLPVDDDVIAFFDLDLCQVCQRRESQISWEEAIADAILQAQAEGGSAESYAAVVAAHLKGLGFKVSPDTVDRPKEEPPADEGEAPA